MALRIFAVWFLVQTIAQIYFVHFTAGGPVMDISGRFLFHSHSDDHVFVGCRCMAPLYFGG